MLNTELRDKAVAKAKALSSGADSADGTGKNKRYVDYDARPSTPERERAQGAGRQGQQGRRWQNWQAQARGRCHVAAAATLEGAKDRDDRPWCTTATSEGTLRGTVLRRARARRAEQPSARVSALASRVPFICHIACAGGDIEGYVI